MPILIQRWITHILALLCIMMLVLIYKREAPDLPFLTADALGNFKTLFISIILEALPFVLLGVFAAALLQQFVSEAAIRRFTPKKPVLGILFACLLGLIFPLCECGMIPVIRRLMQKGMPAYVAVVFILAGPIINPVVYASTYMAFRSRPEIAYSRLAMAFITAATVGLLVFRFVKRNPLREPAGPPAGLSHPQHSYGADGHGGAGCCAHPNHAHHDHDVHHDHDAHHEPHGHAGSSQGSRTDPHQGPSHRHPAGSGRVMRALSVLGHASDEFFDMGKYLIFGAFLTAVMQTALDRDSLVSIGQGEISSHFFMMGLAYLLSLCSTSDAFVASSFATTFSAGSLLTFLVFGPMIDMKSTLMLLSAFRTRFVLILSVLTALTVLAVSLIFQAAVL
ncbi:MULTISPECIES: permease [Paenibacillus]|uniref:permease n=1 Tax=Paenibacillus TaxID=44249 RepID=UPI0022B8F788|nr:permease [Paenibacillus caseinilyticus]MCZ8522767.1 permease [Paenibacillus caseinilyticus]